MNKKIILMFCLVLLVGSVFALPIYVKPLDGSALPSVPLSWGRNLQPSTEFNYTFNFTTNADCTGVVLSNESTIVTAKEGVGFVDIDISGISSVPSYLCEYKISDRNIYKIGEHNIFRIFPGDPTGLPDDFFLLDNFYEVCR